MLKSPIRKTIFSHNIQGGRAGGFTLVEMVIVLAMIGILIAIAFPSFREWQRNAQLKSAARETYAFLQRARGEAVRNNAVVGVRFVTGAGTVGRLEMFVDDGRDGGTAGNLIRDGGEPVLAEMRMPRGVTLEQAGFNNQTAGFRQTGIVEQSEKICLSNGTRFYNLELFAAGSVRMNLGTDCE